MIYFITGNKNKFAEAQAILGEGLEQLDMDLPEIQEMDAKEVVKQKLLEALNHHNGPLIVEDVSFETEALNGFPGPLIKWYLNTLGSQKMYDVANSLGNLNAKAIATIGYAKNHEEIYFFEGVVEGKLAPRVEGNGFGFDKVFIPKGYDKRYSEIKPEEKNKISHRYRAFKELKEFLKNE